LTIDLFEFWSVVGPSDRIHPADRAVFDRLKDRCSHGFDLQCLPCCFMGPLKTAPVVLLYLSFGLDEKDDPAEATCERGQDRYMKMRLGTQPLPGPEEHRLAWTWWKSRTKCFGEWQDLRTKIAVLEIGAYHSRTFKDWPLLAALPSSRASIDWAQGVLFKQAEAGERAVVCLRSSAFWGLEEGQQYGRSLYAPRVNQGGYMLHQPMRETIIRDVQQRVAVPQAQASPSLVA
jgi:hypothetical protein